VEFTALHAPLEPGGPTVHSPFGEEDHVARLSGHARSARLA
jgi:hypothetical protein